MELLVKRAPTTTDPQLPDVSRQNAYCPVEWLPADPADVVGHRGTPSQGGMTTVLGSVSNGSHQHRARFDLVDADPPIMKPRVADFSSREFGYLRGLVRDSAIERIQHPVHRSRRLPPRCL